MARIDNSELKPVGEALDELPGAISGAVVDRDHLPGGGELLLRECLEPSTNGARGVPERHDDADVAAAGA